LKLQNLKIDILEISNLTSLDLKYDFNKKLFIKNTDLDNLLNEEDIDIILKFMKTHYKIIIKIMSYFNNIIEIILLIVKHIRHKNYSY